MVRSLYGSDGSNVLTEPAVPQPEVWKSRHGSMIRGSHKSVFTGGNNMLTIRKSECPKPSRGVGSGKPSVTVRGNGQVFFNRAAMNEIGENKQYLVLGWEPSDRTLVIEFLEKLGKNQKEDDVFKLSYAKKVGGAYAAMSTAFKHEAIGYDYKHAGNQVFEANVEKNKIAFVLPKEVTPSVAVPRKRKNAGANAAAAGATPATTGVTATGANAGTDDVQSID